MPALLFEAFSAFQSESSLLAAVLEFLRYDMVDPLVAERQRFEEQVGALFRILSIARDEMVKRKDLFLVLEKRTMQNLLARGNFKCSAEVVEDHLAVCQALYIGDRNRDLFIALISIRLKLDCFSRSFRITRALICFWWTSWLN